MAADLTRRAEVAFALVLAGLTAVLAGALVYLPLGIDWPAAVAVSAAVSVLVLVETVLDDATFGGQDS